MEKETRAIAKEGGKWCVCCDCCWAKSDRLLSDHHSEKERKQLCRREKKRRERP